MPQSPDRTRLSWAREVMSSLMKTLRRWNWTVRGDRNSRKDDGMRKYGYIGALVALTLALDDADFLGADEGQQA